MNDFDNPVNETAEAVNDAPSVVTKSEVWNVERPLTPERMEDVIEEVRRAMRYRNANLGAWEQAKEEASQAKKDFETAENEMMGVLKVFTTARETTERPVVLTFDYEKKTLTVVDRIDGEVYEERALNDDEMQSFFDIYGPDEDAESGDVPSLPAGEVVDADFEEVDDGDEDAEWAEDDQDAAAI